MTRAGLWFTFFVVIVAAWAVTLSLLVAATAQVVRVADQGVGNWRLGIWGPGVLVLALIGRSAWWAMDKATR